MVCLTINITCNNQGVLNSVSSNAPKINDSRVDPDWYEELILGTDLNNNATLTGRIRFNNETDARNVRAVLRSLNGVFNLCEDGSSIEGHECFINTNAELCTDPIFYDRKINGQIVSKG